MRTVNFDDMPDDESPEPANGTQIGTQTAAKGEPGTAAPADLTSVDEAMAAATADLVAAVVADPHEMLTFGPLVEEAAAEPALPAKQSRSIYDAEHSMTSPSKSLGECVEIVLRNFTRLTPGQVEALHGVLLELGADLDADGEAGGLYGPDFDMTAFIRRMVQTTKAIERQLYVPGEDGMKPAFSAQQLGAITNANKNLMALIAKNHDKVMGWERQRHIEAAHMAAARDLPIDTQDKYLARLQAELEQRGL